jgi:2-oxoglutarate ferredoxin oxidoreductase subunit gamma
MPKSKKTDDKNPEKKASRTEIKLAGFGGQGIILAGYIMGKAASIFDKKHAVLTQAYGPEARGGACSADVIVAETEVDYPKVDIPEILVIMSQEAYTTFGKNISPDGVMLIDEDLVILQKNTKIGSAIYAIPATRFAEELGRKIIANIVMLGFFAAVTDTVTYKAMKDAILSSVPKGTEDLNTNAFQKGYDYGVELLKINK